jgi:phosphatidate cytidylyltransferase
MAPPLGSAKPGDLRLRLISAAALGPVVVAAAWVGAPFLSVLAVAAAALMGWEWGRLIDGGRFDRVGQLLVGAEVLGVGAAALGWFAPALALLCAAAVAAVLLQRAHGHAAPSWAGFGVLWIGLPSVALLWLAADPGTGRATVLWLSALVWATDSAAYFVGRGVGGPRIAPSWSPRKTWSGALGGLVAAGVVGLLTAQILGISALSPVVWISLLVSIASQLGDLGESLAKRRFGVKDASGLIPGHGGFLDRLDGMLAALAAVAVLALVAGMSPVAWG